MPREATLELREHARAVGPDPVAVLRDFRLFCGLLNIRTKAGKIKPFRYSAWHPEQRRFNTERTGRDVVLKPRQIGFSTLELARDFHYALTREGVQVLVIGHHRELIESLFLTVKLFAESLERLGILPTRKYDNVRELVFPALNSAIRVTMAGKTAGVASNIGRSGTIHRAHCTEVAFWGAPGETMPAVMAAVPANGEVVLESTANGAGGYFFEAFQAAAEGRSGYRAHFFPWHEHRDYRAGALPTGFDPAPRDAVERKLVALGISDRQLQWWRVQVDDPAVGLEKALQEFPVDATTAFRTSGRPYFDSGRLDAMVAREPVRTEPLNWKGRILGDLRLFADPQPGRRYVVGGDVAEGVADKNGRPADGSAAVVLDRVTGEHVASFWSDTLAPGDFGVALAVIGRRYNDAEVAPERNNHGHAALRALQVEAEYPIGSIWCYDDGRTGWPTTPATRPPLWDDLRLAIADGSASTPDGALQAELRTVVIDDDGRPRARGKGKVSGAKDDRVVAWAIAHQARSRAPSYWEPKPLHLRGI